MKPASQLDRDDRHQQIRTALRVFGPAIGLVGLGFMAVGLVDFFSAFGGSEPPTKFWCLFVGMPLLAIGGGICQFAFMGSVFRYVSRESNPVVRDSFNELAEGTSGGIRTVARAVGEGFAEARGHRAADEEVACTRCGALGPGDAPFCDQCGASRAALACPRCGKAGDSDARFCRHCGAQLG